MFIHMYKEVYISQRSNASKDDNYNSYHCMITTCDRYHSAGVHIVIEFYIIITKKSKALITVYLYGISVIYVMASL